MVIGKIKVSGTTATVDWSIEIPKGLVGGKVQIEYTDDIWSGLNKTVVFRGSVTRDVLDNGNEVIIPAEVLSRSGSNLFVGVYGTDAEKDLGLPTFWAKLGVIRDAADPEGDPASDPSLPVWAQLLERTPDWLASADSDNHILNRTHWNETQYVDNTFDGNLDGKHHLMLDDGFYMVKVSDTVLGESDLVGATIEVYEDGEIGSVAIPSDMIQDLSSDGIPVIAVSEAIFCVQQNFSFYGFSFEAGTYFMCIVENGESVCYVKSLSCLPNQKEVIHKLEEKYLDTEWMAKYIEGSEEILGEAIQPFSGSTRKTARQSFQFTLEAGQTYEVTWDGETYLCTAGEIREEYIAAAYIGNSYMLDENYPDTGEPFAIACLTIMGLVLFTQIATTDQAESHTIAIRQVGKVRNRIPFNFMPKRYVFPSDFSYTGVVDDELEKAYLHMLSGGEVYANYASSPYKVLMIDYDLWDGQYHSLVMTDGEDIMMWGKDNGWIRHTRHSFMLIGNDGKKYQISVDSNGNLVANATSQF
ncbi:MAG: hypothetical protein IJX67_12400 [Oscillospiraceae bacterium]|nr:hypothetical protein [Oscillospiraceae bacterium]